MSAQASVAVAAVRSGLCGLLESQMLIRIALSKPGDLTEHFRIEVVDAIPRFEGELGRLYRGFLHLGWSIGSDPDNPRKISLQPFDFHRVEIQLKSREDEGFAMFRKGEVARHFSKEVSETISFWHRNATGDGARPYEEWIVEKPFVGIVHVGAHLDSSRPGMLQVNQNQFAFQFYYGLFIARLGAYLERLQDIADRYDENVVVRRAMFAEVLRRFQSFASQARR